MEDLLNICDTVLTYIKDRKEKIETDIAGVDEKIKVNEDDADANNYDYNHLSLLQRATGRSPRLYSDHQMIMKISIRCVPNVLLMNLKVSCWVSYVLRSKNSVLK